MDQWGSKDTAASTSKTSPGAEIKGRNLSRSRQVEPCNVNTSEEQKVEACVAFPPDSVNNAAVPKAPSPVRMAARRNRTKAVTADLPSAVNEGLPSGRGKLLPL